MLAPPNDFGYSPSHAHTLASYDQQQQQQQQHHHHQQHGMQQHSGERPKLFGIESHGPPMHSLAPPHAGMNEFQPMVHGTPHHGMPAQHHNPSEFDHEPLMLNMQHQNHFYPQLGAHMLHVSADYTPNSSVSGVTPTSKNAGSKRSREELNLKEKKRMFKLNDRITALREMLEEAGVQCKKNKQSILDNTEHYISMLRSNLLIAKQKAERAEKQADAYRQQLQSNGSSDGSESMFKRSFDQSSTPRLIVDFDLEVVALNNAFLTHSGQTEEALKEKDTLRSALCVDASKLDSIMKTVTEAHRPVSMIVQARTASGVSALTLMASVIMDGEEKPSNIELSLIPFEISSDIPNPSFQDILVKNDGEDSSPSGVADVAL